ncbi:hypothetical protein DL98DRAFT_566054 [Cadophora sp. DSE1049]|nr:hypothetical protein DL98DRAFT_566054 [Cadophora sp. DSE1049]
MPVASASQKTGGLGNAAKTRRAAKWERLSRRKELLRTHQKATGCEIPPSFDVNKTRPPAMKLEAQSSTAGYIDSCFPYRPYEFSGDNENRANSSARSRDTRSASMSRSTTASKSKAQEKKPSESVEHSEPVRYVRRGIVLSPKDAKKRKFSNAAEYMRLVLDPAIDSSGIKARNPGRLVSRRDLRFLWDSLELYRKKKRQREAREANLSSSDSRVTDSENEVDIEPPRKRVRRSPPSDPQASSTLIKSSSRADLRDRTRKVRFAKQHQSLRGFSSSSGSSTGSETNSAQMLDGKHGHEAPCKERSRSPPNDREATECSAASRFNKDEKHNVKHIFDATAARTTRKRRDSGYSEGLSNSREQYLDYISVLDRLNPIYGCLDTTNASVKHSPKASEISESDGSQITEAGPTSHPKHSTLHILITPPSPKTNKRQLRVVSTPKATRINRTTKSYAEDNERGQLRHGVESLSSDTNKTPLEATLSFTKSSGEDAENDEKPDVPVLVESIETPATQRNRAGRYIIRH